MQIILFKLHYHLNNNCPTANINYMQGILKFDSLTQVFKQTETLLALCTLQTSGKTDRKIDCFQKSLQTFLCLKNN